MIIMEEEDLIKTPEFTIHISYRQGNPIIRLSKEFSNIEDIKMIINNAFTNEPMLIFPTITSKMKALQRLLELGLISYNEKKEKYEFVI